MKLACGVIMFLKMAVLDSHQRHGRKPLKLLLHPTTVEAIGNELLAIQGRVLVSISSTEFEGVPVGSSVYHDVPRIIHANGFMEAL